jgi:glutamine amidotransferase
MIAIIDYDAGNIASIGNMFRYIGMRAVLTRNASEIGKASHIVLPGVGAFDAGMHKIKQYNLDDILSEEVLVKKKPVLGICLGMQLMGKSSDEGLEPGLGWIDMKAHKFQSESLKVPHMGWNDISNFTDNPLIRSEGQRFYFVHSYYVKPGNNEDSIMKTNYGVEFSSAVMSGNILGVQFHPEKSHRFGMSLLSNFGSV